MNFNPDSLILNIDENQTQSVKEKTMSKCARRECNNLSELILGDTNIYICGIPSVVCYVCKQQDYSASSGIGDGQTRIFKKGVLVDQFNSF